MKLTPLQHQRLSARAKNLLWTVSGDYDQPLLGDPDAVPAGVFLYDAAKQGGMGLLFDQTQVSLYLAKKLYLGADYAPLVDAYNLCIDAAVYKNAVERLPGLAGLRDEAYESMLNERFHLLASSVVGRIYFAYISRQRGDDRPQTKQLESAVNLICSLENCADSMELVRVLDELYNVYIEQSFIKRGLTLEKVLEVSLDEMIEEGWFEDERRERFPGEDRVIERTQPDKEDEKERRKFEGVIYVDDEAKKKMRRYVEQVFGGCYLSEKETFSLETEICTGPHAGRRLYYTDGILHSELKGTYRYKYAERRAHNNRREYYSKHRVVKQNIVQLTDALKKALIIRQQRETEAADSGKVVPIRLWRVGRSNTNKIFDREIKAGNTDFAVDVLVDGSGSQSNRQEAIAIQAYIISCALSHAGITHRVMSYCTFWDYTVLQRFVDYGDAPEAADRIFEYSATANNRDGLALKAMYTQLVRRPEENKILIVLSDGRPNDVILNSADKRQGDVYTGKYAIDDTAFEVRRAREQGIAVLGVFAGKEEDLIVEKTIFGKDFAYIHSIENFSQVVANYLLKHIEEY